MIKLIFILLYTLSLISSCAAYEVCFTPQQNCTALITQEIGKARRKIDVQAFVFTSWPIAQALSTAYQHKVDVTIIYDKSNANKPNDLVNLLLLTGIPSYIDYKVAIAHNKVMIIDDKTVITGSFNWTYAAQFHNTENVIIIRDKEIAYLYEQNFEYRKSLSKVFL